MAITKVGAMTDPPVAGDYAILQAKLDAYAKQIGNQGMILTQWVNTTTTPAIALGSYITHGGTLFVVDTEDFAVPAPAGDGTYYLKVSVSGDTLALSWVASTAGYTWNAIYNGLYHSDESQILPYQFVKAGATLTKRKITNLMQGSGFVTVDWTGAVITTSINTGSGAMTFNQGVKTTDNPTFASVDTGQGANELYPMDQGVKTTDSPTFARLTLTTSTYGIQSMGSGATWVVPVGIYSFIHSGTDPNVIFQLYIDSAGWIDDGMVQGVQISDGSHLRIKNNESANKNVAYRKFS